MNYIAKSDSKSYYDAETNLPDNSRDVLLYINNGGSPEYVIGYYIINHWKINGIYINNAQVIAWMDIPKYKR